VTTLMQKNMFLSTTASGKYTIPHILHTYSKWNISGSFGLFDVSRCLKSNHLGTELRAPVALAFPSCSLISLVSLHLDLEDVKHVLNRCCSSCLTIWYDSSVVVALTCVIQCYTCYTVIGCYRYSVLYMCVTYVIVIYVYITCVFFQFIWGPSASCAERLPL
jgi:hypothetical protein